MILKILCNLSDWCLYQAWLSGREFLNILAAVLQSHHGTQKWRDCFKLVDVATINTVLGYLRGFASSLEDLQRKMPDANSSLLVILFPQ
jgi:hypothetical protein